MLHLDYSIGVLSTRFCAPWVQINASFISLHLKHDPAQLQFNIATFYTCNTLKGGACEHHCKRMLALGSARAVFLLDFALLEKI